MRLSEAIETVSEKINSAEYKELYDAAKEARDASMPTPMRLPPSVVRAGAETAGEQPLANQLRAAREFDRLRAAQGGTITQAQLRAFQALVLSERQRTGLPIQGVVRGDADQVAALSASGPVVRVASRDYPIVFRDEGDHGNA